MRWYASLVRGFLQALGRDVDLVAIIDDFGELIYREIDYRAEAINAQRFAELYSRIPDVIVPKVYTELSTSKVLTMEWVDGVRLTNKELVGSMGLDSSHLIDTLVQCTLRQLLENGFFHADPHAGNLLATEEGKLCYLDFGMVSYVERSQRYSIIEAVVHLVNRDFTALADLYQRMGFIPEDVDSKPIVVALEDALPDVLNAPVGELNFKNVISKLGDVMYKFPFSLPPYYIAIIRCLGVLEGVAIQVDNDFKIINDAYPYIASRLLTDPSVELQRALRQLLFKGDYPRWERLQDLLDKASLTSDYEATVAIDGLIEFLDSPEAAGLRDTLSEDIVEFSDKLSVDGLLYLQNIFSQVLETQSSIGGISRIVSLIVDNARNVLAQGAPPEPSQFADQMLQEFDLKALPELPESINLVIKSLELIRGTGTVDIDVVLSIRRKIGQRPNIQRLLAKIISQISERQSARLVKAAFNQ
jgi:predicted unusual protein kinase regulating ubiquinone biosynthesis (AarF/ABC1/UbiB family)